MTYPVQINESPGNIKILIVEKDHDPAAAFRSRLRQHGYHVDLARPGNLDVVRYAAADCVVAHATLGFRRNPTPLIRLHEQFPGIPLIVVPLGHSDGSHSEPNKDGTGLIFFTESFTLDDLQEEIYRQVQNRRSIYPK